MTYYLIITFSVKILLAVARGGGGVTPGGCPEVILPMMAYVVRPRPKGIPFPSFMYLKGYGFRESKHYFYKRCIGKIIIQVSI